MADRLGQQFGNYHLTRLLGKGGFAEVYLGEHIHLETQAAIKVLHVHMANNDVEAFRNEARTVARLKHPHIVQVLDYGLEDDTPFLVMSYASHGTLRDRHPKNTRLALPDILSYTKQVSSAIQYAHKQNIIHCDVKPENMLLDDNDQVLLSDFGLALIARSSLSQSAQKMKGTVYYMAPEQIKGKPRPASDQYSLGIIIYEWLCGERPFSGAFTEICTQHLFTPPPPLQGKGGAVSPQIEEVVLKALAKEPEARFASIEEFVYEFEQACQTYKPTSDIMKSYQSQPSKTALEDDEDTLSAPIRKIENITLLAPPITPVHNNISPTAQLSKEKETEDQPRSAPALLARTQSYPLLNHKPDQFSTEIPHRLKKLPTTAITTNIVTLPVSTPTHRAQKIYPANVVAKQAKHKVPSQFRYLDNSNIYKHSTSIISICIVSLLIIVGTLTAFIFYRVGSYNTARITVSPIIHPVSNTFTLNTNASLQGIDPGTSSLPISTLTTTTTVSKTGPTSGKQLSCVLLGIDCGTKAVSDNDINQLTQPIKQDPQTTQDLKAQLQTKSATEIGQPTIKTLNGDVNPPVGTKSDTVTVSLTEQASVQYVLNKDVQDLTRALLLQKAQQQFGSNYQLIDQQTQFSSPQVQDGSSPIKILVAVGGLAEYHISANQLSSIKGLIKGKSTQDALAILAKQLGVNPNTSIVSVSYGNRISDDINQIIIMVVNPINLPPVQVPLLPAGANVGG